jgi:antitoxin MazE
MRSNIARWGNSLAVRLPADQLKALGLAEGAAVDVELAPEGSIRIAPAHSFDKAAFLKRLSSARARMPESDPVIDILRGEARY